MIADFSSEAMQRENKGATSLQYSKKETINLEFYTHRKYLSKGKVKWGGGWEMGRKWEED